MRAVDPDPAFFNTLLERLRDAELRDIVTYLVGDDASRIFQRKPKPSVAPRTEAPSPPLAPPVARR